MRVTKDMQKAYPSLRHNRLLSRMALVRLALVRISRQHLLKKRRGSSEIGSNGVKCCGSSENGSNGAYPLKYTAAQKGKKAFADLC